MSRGGRSERWPSNIFPMTDSRTRRVISIVAQKGGEIIDVESSQWVQTHGPVSHDSPAYTGAGKLPCRYVIHAVGPVWGSGNEDAKLASAIEGSLKLAEQLQLTSIAFPAISTGIFRFPVSRAAGVFYDTLQQYFEAHPTSPLTLVRIVLYDQMTLSQFINTFTAWLAAHS